MSRPFPVLALGIAVAGCATTPPPPSPIPIVATPSRLFLFRNLRAEPAAPGIAVSGETARKRKRFRYPGHIHIEAISRGQVIAWTDARWRPPSYRLTFASSHFRATLPVDAAQVDQILVAYWREGHGGANKPGNPQ